MSVAGSVNDDPQLRAGWQVQSEALSTGTICNLELPGISEAGLTKMGIGHYVISGHRNTIALLKFLIRIATVAKANPELDFVLVMAAGWAAILPGLGAAYLYHKLKAVNVFVVGVALEYLPKPGEKVAAAAEIVLNSQRNALQIFSALNAKQRRDLAALLSISELPGAKLLVSDDEHGPFFGAAGFKRACEFAVSGEISETLRQAVQEVKAPLPSFRKWQAAIKALAEVA